jgi:hypothetical protein
MRSSHFSPSSTLSSFFHITQTTLTTFFNSSEEEENEAGRERGALKGNFTNNTPCQKGFPVTQISRPSGQQDAAAVPVSTLYDKNLRSPHKIVTRFSSP